jgi:hypothetical protein
LCLTVSRWSLSESLCRPSFVPELDDVFELDPPLADPVPGRVLPALPLELRWVPPAAAVVPLGLAPGVDVVWSVDASDGVADDAGWSARGRPVARVGTPATD